MALARQNVSFRGGKNALVHVATVGDGLKDLIVSIGVHGVELVDCGVGCTSMVLSGAWQRR